MRISELNNQMRLLSRDAIENNRGLKWFREQIRTLLNQANLAEELEAELEANMMREHTFVADRTISAEVRQSIVTLFAASSRDYATISGELNVSIALDVESGLRAGKTSKEINDMLTARLEGFRVRVQTITQTAIGAFDTIATIEGGKAAKMTRLKLVGPAPEREWCKEHINETHTKEEWSAMDNGQGLPVLYYRGGYNCRHRFINVE
jgi:hypothetical protein